MSKRDRLNVIYSHMKTRCYNKNRWNYQYYGARGIKICDEWKNNYQAFKKWALENGYQDNLSIDRIDVNGNYEPNNVRLISHKQQQSNKRNTHYFLAYKDNEIVLSNNTIEFGKIYNVNGRSVGNCLRGKSKSAGGWTFKNITKEEFEVLLKEDGSVTTKVVV